MGGNTDRTLCRLSSVRMLMRGECNRGPEGQQHAQTRYPLRYRTHDGYSMEAFPEFIPKHQTNANDRVPSQVCIGYLRNALLLREFEPHGIAVAWLILFGRTKRSLGAVQFTSVLCLLAARASGGDRQNQSKSPTRRRPLPTE
jgi:hypothetical protein